LPRTYLLAAALLLGGCATRTYTPVAISQPGDDALSCPVIAQQIADNNAAEAVFVRKDKNAESGNAVKTVGTAIPYVGILVGATMDLSNEDQAKARALADRNEHLAYLAKQKGCTS
jgi:hypothetical protein